MDGFEVMEEAEKFRLMTYLDPLTTMWNRTYFENQVNLYLQEKDPKGFFFILDINLLVQIRLIEIQILEVMCGMSLVFSW